MITYKDILVNSFAYGYKYYMAHIYFYMPLHSTDFFNTPLILITNKTIDKKSSHNPYTQDYARFFV